MKKLITRICATLLLVFSTIFGTLNLLPSTPVYAEETPETVRNEETAQNTADTPETPQDEQPTSDEDTAPEDGETTKPTAEEAANVCKDQTGSLSWLVCPGSGVIASATDALYGAISDMLEVAPLSMANDSPIYLVWQYARNITNILFIIFLIIVIYSQITGLGINNYGIKRVLPRLIIAVVLVNLSFLICSIAVDASNLIGADLRGTFTSIQNDIIMSSGAPDAEMLDYSLSAMLTTIISGGAIAGVAVGIAGGAGYVFFMFLVVLIGALIAVITGLITIAARQALVALLIMIAPLAFVAYLLPNTEKWFTKWKDLLFQMLIFYPVFSLLFGASQLLGYALITSATSELGIILGVAVQIFPLFFSWSLMKMSGTVLGSLNTGLRRLAAPLQRTLTGFTLGAAEQQRQRYAANSMMPGAKLRRYLDYRESLRQLDTDNSKKIREGKALERTYKFASSSTGYDENGNASWRKRANRYTANAKRAALYDTRTNTAASAYKNTLGAYGRNFSGAEAAALADAHAEAYKDAMAQQFLTVNEAQADQEYLLNQYLDAAKALKDGNDTYWYNRLIKSAAGGLGHNGESSIMGQVITGNSAIETRRRGEARIIITKFGINKRMFRAMAFDKAYINDNGYETDADGNVIEDDQYHLTKKPGSTEYYQHTPWQQYIAIHKTTGREISRAEYDALSANDRNTYRKVRYFDITDDSGNSVQRVFEDDAGYMKELLTDDINIGDPINRRYLVEIGNGRTPDEHTGILRRYHSTVSAAELVSRYKDHAAEVTPMITAQANMGYINTIGHYNIANLQSLNVAAKAGSILQNDKYAIETWRKLVSTINDEKAFANYFPDEDIMSYRDVNGQSLPGLEKGKDDDGNIVWKEVGHDKLKDKTDDETLELRKNFIKHKILPKTVNKLMSSMNRNISPSILENQKPDTLQALLDLADTLIGVSKDNADKKRDFEKRLDANQDLFGSKNPDAVRQVISQAIREQEQLTNSKGPDPNKQPKSQSGNLTLEELIQQLSRAMSQQQTALQNTDPNEIIHNINSHLNFNMNIDTFAESMRSYLGSLPGLAVDPGWQQVIDDYMTYNQLNHDNFISNITNPNQQTQELADQLIDYIQNHYGTLRP